MRWYLDGVLISSDYMTASSGAETGAFPEHAGPRGRYADAPSATHGNYPGHHDAVKRAGECDFAAAARLR